eukprot:CAMPEP_0194279470 /NCGR_PEP_ID=MMETSP0169-20130528/13942_1 /TAXON_ID=218684 /ORGANISM="Corethron pennatum, Strain L29A3" /LENGTH=757 /DNA_ID=CAMNT_0039023897 /DNA_START=238 /DNA_END=2512 /DNA_ORIENTATION=+
MKRQRSIPGPSFHAATAVAAATIFLLLSAPSLATELSRVRVSQRSTRNTDSAPKVHDATLKNLHSLMRQTQEITPETNNESSVKSSKTKTPKSAEKAKEKDKGILKPSGLPKSEKGTKKSKQPTVSKPENVAPKKTRHPKVSKSEKETKIPKTASKKASKDPKVLTLAPQFTTSKKSKKSAKVKCQYSNTVKGAKRRLDNGDQDVVTEKNLRQLKRSKKTVLDEVCDTDSTKTGKHAKHRPPYDASDPTAYNPLSDPNASGHVGQSSPQKPNRSKSGKNGVVYLAVTYNDLFGKKDVEKLIQSGTARVLNKGSKGGHRVLLDRTEDIFLPSRALENETVTSDSYEESAVNAATVLDDFRCPEAAVTGINKICVLVMVEYGVYVWTMVDGNKTIVDGNSTIDNGNKTIVGDNETIVDGNGTVVDSNKIAVDSNETTVDGNNTAVDSIETVDEGTKAPVVGNETVGQVDLHSSELVSSVVIPASAEPGSSNLYEPGVSDLGEGNKQVGVTVVFGNEPGYVETKTEADTGNTNTDVSDSASPTSTSDQAEHWIQGGGRRKLLGQESGMVESALKVIKDGTINGEFLEENSGITNVMYIGNSFSQLSNLKADASPKEIPNSGSWITWMVVALAVVSILLLSCFTFKRARRINDTNEKSLRRDFYDDCEHDLDLDVTEDFDNSMDDDITMSTNHSRPYEAEVGTESQYMDSYKNGNSFQAEVGKNDDSFQPADPYNLAKKSSGVDAIIALLHHVTCVGILQA